MTLVPQFFSLPAALLWNRSDKVVSGSLGEETEPIVAEMDPLPNGSYAFTLSSGAGNDLVGGDHMRRLLGIKNPAEMGKARSY